MLNDDADADGDEDQAAEDVGPAGRGAAEAAAEADADPAQGPGRPYAAQAAVHLEEPGASARSRRRDRGRYPGRPPAADEDIAGVHNRQLTGWLGMGLHGLFWLVLIAAIAVTVIWAARSRSPWTSQAPAAAK